MKLPCLPYVDDMMKSTFTFFITIFINVAFLFSILVNINKIIDEKSTKMKEYLKLIGIKWYTLWLSWFLRILLGYLIISVLLALFGIISFSESSKEFGKDVHRAIFLKTNFFVILSTFVVYSIQSSSFIVLVSQFFKKREINRIFFSS